MAPKRKKKKTINFHKWVKLIFGLILCSFLWVFLVKNINKDVIGSNPEPYLGEVLKANYMANLLGDFKGNNKVISSYDVLLPTLVMRDAADNLTKIELNKFLFQIDRNIDSKLVNSIELYKKEELSRNDYHYLYEKLLNDYDQALYGEIDLEKLTFLKQAEKETFILLLEKIQKAYLEIVQNDLNVKGERSYSVDEINNYQLTSDEKNMNENDILELNTKIKLERENYNLNNAVYNISYLFYDEGNNVNKQFGDKVYKDYNTNVEKLSFKREPLIAAKEINNKIATETNNKIKYVINSSNLQKEMIMVNSFYFNYRWDQEFNVKLNTEEDFFKDEENVRTVVMMHSTEDIYLKNDYAVGFIKNFENGIYQFIGILPNENITDISYANVDNLLNSVMKDKKVNIAMPKFKFYYDYTLKDFYLSNGISSIYSNDANFSRLSSDKIEFEDVYIKNWIEIGEKGTSSTNVDNPLITSFVTDTNNANIVFNRPFYFLIRDKEKETILLAGYVSEP